MRKARERSGFRPRSGDNCVTTCARPGKTITRSGGGAISVGEPFLIPGQLRFSRIARAFSRTQSRSFSASRLSCCFLPLARPIESFTRPLL